MHPSGPLKLPKTPTRFPDEPDFFYLTRTLTVVMFQALESGGSGGATAASTLILVTLLPIALGYRLVRRYALG